MGLLLFIIIVFQEYAAVGIGINVGHQRLPFHLLLIYHIKCSTSTGTYKKGFFWGNDK